MIDIEANADLAMFDVSCLRFPTFWRDVVAVADIIVGVDRNDPRRGAVFYGQDALWRISSKGQPVPMRAVRIMMDFSPGSTDPAVLCAAVTSARGHCDYADDGAEGN